MIKNGIIALAITANSLGLNHANDVVTLKTGKTIEGSSVSIEKGKLNFVDKDGKSVTFSISSVDTVEFAQSPEKAERQASEIPEAEKPLRAPVNAQGGFREYRNAMENVEVPILPEGCKLAYFAMGNNDVDRNSETFQHGAPSVYFIALWKTGDVPYAYLTCDGIKDDEIVGGSISNSDFGDKTTFFGSKTHYKGESGEAFADVTTNDTTWMVAVVNFSELPSRNKIERCGKTLLKFGGFPEIELEP